MKYDLATAEASISKLATSFGAITPYVQAVLGITLGPQPIGDGGSWDPLSGLGVQGALATAQQHCQTFQSNVGALGVFPTVLKAAATGNDGIVNQLSTVQGVLNDLDGKPASDAQKQTVIASLGNVHDMLNGLNKFLSIFPGPTATFVDEMSGDGEALTQGSSAIASALTSLEANYKQDVIKYSQGFGGDAIVKVLEQITVQMKAQLDAIQSNIATAISLGPQATESLSQLQGVFVGQTTEFNDTITAINEASASQLGSFIQSLDVERGITFWNDACAFAEAHFGGGTSL